MDVQIPGDLVSFPHLLPTSQLHTEEQSTEFQQWEETAYQHQPCIPLGSEFVQTHSEQSQRLNYPNHTITSIQYRENCHRTYSWKCNKVGRAFQPITRQMAVSYHKPGP